MKEIPDQVRLIAMLLKSCIFPAAEFTDEVAARSIESTLNSASYKG
jgi:hypothetical protein